LKVSGIIQSIAGLVPSCCPASPECYCRRAFTRSQVEATQGWRDHELADERDTRAGHVLSGPGSCHLCPLPETCSSGDGCALARSIAGRLRSRPPAGSTRRSAPAPTPLVRGVRCVSSVESVRIPRFLLTFLHFFFRLALPTPCQFQKDLKRARAPLLFVPLRRVSVMCIAHCDRRDLSVVM
jgi:hypothetical protein